MTILVADMDIENLMGRIKKRLNWINPLDVPIVPRKKWYNFLRKPIEFGWIAADERIETAIERGWKYATHNDIEYSSLFDLEEKGVLLFRKIIITTNKIIVNRGGDNIIFGYRKIPEILEFIPELQDGNDKSIYLDRHKSLILCYRKCNQPISDKIQVLYWKIIKKLLKKASSVIFFENNGKLITTELFNKKIYDKILIKIHNYLFSKKIISSSYFHGYPKKCQSDYYDPNRILKNRVSISKPKNDEIAYIEGGISGKDYINDIFNPIFDEIDKL